MRAFGILCFALCLTFTLADEQRLDRRPAECDGEPTPMPASIEPAHKVEVVNFPDPQNVAGTVNVGNLPTVQAVDGTVTVTNLPAVQAVVGTVEVSNVPAVQQVAGTVEVSNLADVELTGSVEVTNLPSVQAVSGSVSISNLPTSQGPPRFRFVGVTAQTFRGDAGWLAMTRACEQAHPGSRMAFSDEIWETVSPPDIEAAAWVTLRVEAAAGTGTGAGFVVDRHGNSIGSYAANCSGWSFNAGGALSLNPNGSIAGGRSCTESLAVACAAPE